MSDESDQTFINMLLQETYEFVPEEELVQTNSDLEEYFHACENNLKNNNKDIVLLNFLEKNCHEIYDIGFNYKTSCFSVRFDKEVLDFPKTWGEFEYLSKSILEDKNLFCEFEEEYSDLRGILSTLENNMVKPRHFFIVKNSNDYCLVSVDGADLAYFKSWIFKYLRVEENIPFQFTDAA